MSEKGRCYCQDPEREQYILGTTSGWAVRVEKMPVCGYMLHVTHEREHLALQIYHCPLCGAKLDDREKED